MHPGAGESVKAAVSANARAVIICKTQAHKDMVARNVADFVKVHRIVSIEGSLPAKPAQLVQWEASHRVSMANSTMPSLEKPPAPAMIGAPPVVPIPAPTVVAPLAPVSAPAPVPKVNPPSMLAGFGVGKL